ncbi:MAG: NAD(P)H-binding protein [Bacteriovorax sp.]|nr:NAD(P)H-binding protein [Rhizobacter sp.]
MASTVLILGAAGRIGQVLASTFADAGWAVLAQARKPLPAALAGRPRVRPVRCDATDVAALSAAAQGATVIVNALNPLYTEWARLAQPLADAALDAARASGALLMLPGNVYNFGRELPPLLTPATVERSDTPKARIRIELEARLGAAAHDGVDSVVIRAGDFFGGPGTGTWFDMAMASKLDKGRFVYPGNPDIAHAWAYLPDLAQVFVRVAAQRAQMRGHHRLHFAGHTLTGNALKAAAEGLVGRPLRTGNLPWGVIRLLAPFKPMWRELLVMRYLWERPHALDDAALRSLIGAVPQTPLPVALRAALAALKIGLPAGALAAA